MLHRFVLYLPVVCTSSKMQLQGCVKSERIVIGLDKVMPPLIPTHTFLVLVALVDGGDISLQVGERVSNFLFYSNARPCPCCILNMFKGRHCKHGYIGCIKNYIAPCTTHYLML